jgi:hypothetical protein
MPGLTRELAGKLPWKRLFAELAVIVAGVLIALAADSWWEKRQERQRAEQYLRQLLVDFRQTERGLQNSIEGDTRTLESATKVIERAYRGRFGLADSLQMPSGYQQFTPLTGTLTALVQGGDLRLLKGDSLRFALIAYAAMIQETETILRHTETLIWNSHERATLARARHSHSAARRGTNAGSGWGEIDVAGALNDPEIISALQIQAMASQIRLFNRERLQKPTQRIIRLIQAELGEE